MKLTPLLLSGCGSMLLALPARAQTAHYLSLDGQDDQLYVANVQGLNGLDAFTLEGWVRSTGGNLADKLLEVGTDPNYRLTLEGSCGTLGQFQVNEEQLGMGSNVTVPVTAACDGQWHHLAATDDGSTLRFYVDGVEAGTSPALGLTWDMDGRELRLGAHIVGWTDFWTGDLDEFRVWRRPLTAAEVATSATWQIPKDQSGLVSWWDFESGAQDAMGLNHGSLVADATIVATPGFVDCNGNGVIDSYDIASGTSDDCNQDGTPDECQLVLWNSTDFATGVPPEMGLEDHAEWIGGAVRLNGGPGSFSSADVGEVHFHEMLMIDPDSKTGVEWSFRFKIDGTKDIMSTRLLSSDYYVPGADRFLLNLEFDHYYNWDQPLWQEPNDNHLSIRAQVWSGGTFNDYWPGHYIPSFTLSNGGWHTARVRIQNGGLSAWITPDGGVEEQAFDSVPLPWLWADPCDLSVTAWNGSGPGGNEHWVDDMAVNISPCGNFLVTQVLPRASWLASDLEVQGAGFDGAETVTVDGVPATVSAWTPTSLSVSLPPSAPGSVEVAVAHGAFVDHAVAQLWPSLAAHATGIGGTATIDLGFTGVGLHVLASSPTTMAPVQVGDTWHGFELGMTPGFVHLGVAVSTPDGNATWAFPIPADPSLTGVTVHLQAWSQEGFFAPAASSFSNTVALTL